MMRAGNAPAREFDYVIVGSGSAGSIVSSRLGAAGANVLLIEAGGRDRGFWLKLPVGYFKSIYNPRVSHLYRTEPGEGVAGRRIDAPRGRVMGGSSSINGLIFIRGQHEDFDDWAALGAAGWSYEEVLPFFRRLERWQGPASQWRGQTGELHVSPLRNRNAACDQWLEAARQWGLPDNDDFNGASSIGVGSYDLTLRGRWRESAATAFLRPAQRDGRVELLLNSTVTRVLVERGRAIGVEVHSDGQTRRIMAAERVILSAGAVQSPQLLQLSGIGPATLLRQHSIDVIVDAPEIGENLQDHLQMRTVVELKDGVHSLNAHVRNPVRLARMGLDWLINASGPLTVGAGQVGGAVCSPLAIDDRPDLQLFVMPLSVDKPGTPLHRYPGFTVSYWQCHPESRGHVRIASADPFADPSIQPNYLTAPHDQAVVVEGLRIVREIYRQSAFRDLWRREIVPGDDVTGDSAMLEAVRRMSSTVYHLVGTCRMGLDDAAPVAPDLSVKGVERLSVVDASVMPKIVSANSNAATCMIAEKAAESLLATRPEPAS